MDRSNRRDVRKLGDALGDRQYSYDLFRRELKLADRGREQALADAIQLVGRSWPPARLSCLRDQPLVGLATPPAPVGHALLGVGVGGFDHQFSCQRSPKRGPSLPCDDRLGCAATHKVRIASVPANARRCNVSRYAVGAADAPKCECIGQSGAAAQKRDRMVNGERDGDGAAQVLLTGNGVQPTERRRQDRATAGTGLTQHIRRCMGAAARSAWGIGYRSGAAVVRRTCTW